VNSPEIEHVRQQNHIKVVSGDLLDQKVQVIVNAWNRNVIPWWLLLPQGVSGAIKRRAGVAPFKELARHGRMGLGEAVLTGAGRLPFKGLFMWRASICSGGQQKNPFASRLRMR
jgi:O-acetyl-ADP-ribose deacetylase